MVKLLVAYRSENGCAPRAGPLSREAKDAHLLEEGAGFNLKSAR